MTSTYTVSVKWRDKSRWRLNHIRYWHGLALIMFEGSRHEPIKGPSMDNLKHVQTTAPRRGWLQNELGICAASRRGSARCVVSAQVEETLHKAANLRQRLRWDEVRRTNERRRRRRQHSQSQHSRCWMRESCNCNCTELQAWQTETKAEGEAEAKVGRERNLINIRSTYNSFFLYNAWILEDGLKASVARYFLAKTTKSHLRRWQREMCGAYSFSPSSKGHRRWRFSSFSCTVDCTEYISDSWATT